MENKGVKLTRCGRQLGHTQILEVSEHHIDHVGTAPLHSHMYHRLHDCKAISLGNLMDDHNLDTASDISYSRHKVSLYSSMDKTLVDI